MIAAGKNISHFSFIFHVQCRLECAGQISIMTGKVNERHFMVWQNGRHLRLIVEVCEWIDMPGEVLCLCEFCQRREPLNNKNYWNTDTLICCLAQAHTTAKIQLGNQWKMVLNRHRLTDLFNNFILSHTGSARTLMHLEGQQLLRSHPKYKQRTTVSQHCFLSEDLDQTESRICILPQFMEI